MKILFVVSIIMLCLCCCDVHRQKNNCPECDSWSNEWRNYIGDRDTISVDTCISFEIILNPEFADTVICLNKRVRIHCHVLNNEAKIVFDNKEIVFVSNYFLTDNVKLKLIP